MKQIPQQLVVGVSVLLASGTAIANEGPSAAPPEASSQEAAMAAAVGENMDIGMEYTLTSEGEVVDSTDGRGPFHYVHGAGQILPGLERQLIGLHVGDAKEVTLAPEDGYGVVDPAAFVEVAKSQLPQDVTPEIGMVLRGMNPDGQNFRATISEINGDNVTLNLNHPLAGKTLTFKVKITDVAPVKVQ